jgi:hypothetical protein
VGHIGSTKESRWNSNKASLEYPTSKTAEMNPSMQKVLLKEVCPYFSNLETQVTLGHYGGQGWWGGNTTKCD